MTAKLTEQQKANMLKWAEVLETTQIQQAKSSLCTKKDDGTVGMCCLGVACDIYAKETGKGFWDKRYEGWIEPGSEPSYQQRFVLNEMSENYYAPAEVCQHFGLTPFTNMSARTSFPHVEFFAEMNDKGGLSFAEIAGVIREKIAELETDAA